MIQISFRTPNIRQARSGIREKKITADSWSTVFSKSANPLDLPQKFTESVRCLRPNPSIRKPIHAPRVMKDFLSRKTPLLLKKQLPELEGIRDSWHDVTTHSETQTFFYTWHTVNLIGRGCSGNFKARSYGVKISESDFLSWNTFYTL